MGQGGLKGVGGNPRSVIYECHMLEEGLGLHCGFHVLYLPLLAHLIPVQRLPGSRGTVIVGLGALSLSMAQAAFCFQVGTSTNQTSDAFYVTAYVRQSPP